jgi:diguanylate cyclase (GGDEF)-like protein
MSILIVDDSAKQRMLLQHYLKKGGITDVALAGSADEAFEVLEADSPDQSSQVDVILMDIVLPGINGIEACRIIGGKEHLRDIPIVMVTGMTDMENLELAFSAGAIDYISKPVKAVELLARVRSLLKLKQEMDLRKSRERELLEATHQLMKANQVLERLSLLDGLTEIGNRRYFDIYLDREWKRAVRENKPLSMLFIDIDHFKAFNDTYGHQQGDECLKQVAGCLNKALKRPGDFLTRYGGEEFAAILPDTDVDGAVFQAEIMCSNIEDLAIPHTGTSVSDRVTISIGVASVIPCSNLDSSALIASADQALYKAKQAGRNRLEWIALECEKD